MARLRAIACATVRRDVSSTDLCCIHAVTFHHDALFSYDIALLRGNHKRELAVVHIPGKEPDRAIAEKPVSAGRVETVEPAAALVRAVDDARAVRACTIAERAGKPAFAAE